MRITLASILVFALPQVTTAYSQPQQVLPAPQNIVAPFLALKTQPQFPNRSQARAEVPVIQATIAYAAATASCEASGGTYSANGCYVPPPPPPPVYVSYGNGYDYGECTYLVASLVRVPSSLGNANTWASRAADMGYTVSSVPKVGAVAQTSAGYYGHVALIVAVGNGQVEVEEMNAVGWNVIDYQWYPANSFVYIYF